MTGALRDLPAGKAGVPRHPEERRSLVSKESGMPHAKNRLETVIGIKKYKHEFCTYFD